MTIKHHIKIPPIPDIPEDERSPIVDKLIDICTMQQELIVALQEQIQILKDEIARLKNQSPRPRIKPSTLESRSGKSKRGKKPNTQNKKKNPHDPAPPRDARVFRFITQLI
jgi:hypothetical protein